MLTASTPRRSADSAWRTLVHLWMMRRPRRLAVSMKAAGLLPAVSSTRTPLSMAAARYSAYGGGLTEGSMVRLTPNGWSVIARQRAISSASACGVGWVSAVSTPSPPALETADASSALPTHCMPPWMMG